VRLFLAVNLPDAVRSAIWDAAAPLRNAELPVRWVEPEGLHLTLKFLGEVSDNREAEIVAGLNAAVHGAKPFALEIAGFGAFPTPGRPRVVWAGCEAAPALELLQDRVEREMHALGFPLEGRPFHPHITLGRVRKRVRPRDVPDLEDALAALSCHEVVTVQSVDLMQSTLRPSGAEYSVRYAAGFDGKRGGGIDG
jgi:2'-5' RNA ligase